MADKTRVFQAEEIMGAEGAAWLKRTQKQVDGRVMARVNMENTPYTIWWVIFNNPKKCATSPCDVPDLFNPAVEAAVFNAGGAISAATGDGKGVINLNISVLAGESGGNGAQMAPFPPFDRPLNKGNGLKAEIHIVIDRHMVDPMDPDWVFELTYPEVTEAFAIFLAVGEDDDSDG